MTPVRIKKVKGGFRVYDGNRITARRTTKRKAERQANLLRGVAHGFVPRKR